MHYHKFFCLSFVALLLLCGGCNKPVQGAVKATPSAPGTTEMLTPVRVVNPHRGEIAAYFETTSRVEAENRVEILSKGAGQCTDVMVDVGDAVKSGDVLAVLEKAELEAQVRQGAHQYAAAKNGF